MIKNLALLALLLGLGLAYTWQVDFAAKPTAQTAAPDFNFKDLDGGMHALSDHKGKTIVLNFWATWCAPCIVEMPQMFELAKAQPDIVFLFLSIDEDPGKIRPFLKKYKLDMQPENVLIASDSYKRISKNLYGTVKIPETYLISPSLVIADKIIGADVSWTDAEMREKLRRIAANVAPE